ncbi:MAG: hypothetical protein DRJ34_04355 [Thermoprotei archaeon]|nr:MAG: hypothetical protein DRJ34_04355 [Thermoprotei archaeon]
MKIVIDASVAVKWFNIEEYSDEAVKLKNLHVAGIIKLIAPLHLIYEVGNSIWKNRQINNIDASNAVLYLLELEISLIPPDRKSIKRIMEIARNKNISFYDACYIELAEKYGIPLISADKKQIEASKDIIKIFI